MKAETMKHFGDAQTSADMTPPFLRRHAGFSMRRRRGLMPCTPPNAKTKGNKASLGGG